MPRGVRGHVLIRELSEEERKAYNREATARYRERLRLVRPPRPSRPCLVCQWALPSVRTAKARYCSRRCKSRAFYKTHGAEIRDRVRTRKHLLVYGHTEFKDNPVRNPKDRYGRARALGYRSGLEVSVARQLEEAGVAFEYEPFKIPFLQPEKRRHYTPDYKIPNGIIVETKGLFPTSDRQKALMVKAAHPDLDIRFVFSNPLTKISKQSKTTFAKWCETNGFLYAKALIPTAWLHEPTNARSLAAIERLQK